MLRAICPNIYTVLSKDLISKFYVDSKNVREKFLFHGDEAKKLEKKLEKKIKTVDSQYFFSKSE